MKILSTHLSTQWLWRQRWIVPMVVLPTLATAAYEGLFASDIYVSESRFVIKAPAQKSAQVSSLANLIQTTGLSGGQEQANEVIDYIRSRSALAALNRGGAGRWRPCMGRRGWMRWRAIPACCTVQAMNACSAITAQWSMWAWTMKRGWWC
ncbi:MAG: hypothetical protein ABT10_10885 [Novosphingobium sp. SCN 63-17]|nr:hypothetical protein [Novosphingobium sp. 1748]ODU82386.1 MAG: hypothetical protein ABT10_10885 [Novosphingobium sp. SCN 63-17]OJX97115.1 MAG: hypothetical protein BGP00_03905 [Novosphingobium sp. 63-713]